MNYGAIRVIEIIVKTAYLGSEKASVGGSIPPLATKTWHSSNKPAISEAYSRHLVHYAGPSAEVRALSNSAVDVHKQIRAYPCAQECAGSLV